MVDSISSIGGAQAADAVRKAQLELQNKNKESAAAKESGKGQGPQDAVEISAEAAQRIAEDAKLALVDNSDITLGLNPTFDTAV